MIRTVPIRTPPPKHKIPERISRANGDRSSPVDVGVHPSHLTIKIGIIPSTIDTNPRTDLENNYLKILKTGL